MTVAIVGLESGTGTSVMKRIAAPMVGGMISTTVLTLLVIPALRPGNAPCDATP